ncbi:MAG: hypothetical protein Q9195_000201 [Heterodermia aff. obscurata]
MRACLGVLRSSKSYSSPRLFIPICFNLQSLPTFHRQHRTYTSAVSAAELQFGQSLHETHPHLLRPGERITAQEYAQRRSRLAAKLPNDGIAILAAADVKYRSGAVFYDFHQDPNFFYLTGFNEPDAVAIVAGKTHHHGDHSFHLFLRPKDPKAEQWDGARSGAQAAVDVFNADESGDINNIQALLKPFIGAASEIYTDLALQPKPSSIFSRLFAAAPPKAEGLGRLFENKKLKPLKPLMNDLRVVKSDAEIANMRAAGQASGRSFTEAMHHAWTREKDLAAFIEYKFKRHGCDGSAYVPVVAGGQNASMIHYVRNDDLLRKEDLVLVDAGGEYGGYITDITRTWPLSGQFNDAQKDLYTAVLSTQRSCISMCRASAGMSLDKLHEIAEESLKDSLSQLGFNMSGKAIEALLPHHLSHYIGLDVHDTPGQSRNVPLEARQCVTIEPGLYIPDTDSYPAHFRGMGIRIEDSVCVEDDHPLVLTTEAVKEVDDIEALRA